MEPHIEVANIWDNLEYDDIWVGDIITPLNANIQKRIQQTRSLLHQRLFESNHPPTVKTIDACLGKEARETHAGRLLVAYAYARCRDRVALGRLWMEIRATDLMLFQAKAYMRALDGAHDATDLPLYQWIATWFDMNTLHPTFFETHIGSQYRHQTLLYAVSLGWLDEVQRILAVFKLEAHNRNVIHNEEGGEELEDGAIQPEGPDLETLFEIAAQNGHTNIFQLLAAEKCHCGQLTTADIKRAITVALREGHIAIAEWICLIDPVQPWRVYLDDICAENAVWWTKRTTTPWFQKSARWLILRGANLLVAGLTNETLSSLYPLVSRSLFSARPEYNRWVHCHEARIHQFIAILRHRVPIALIHFEMLPLLGFSNPSLLHRAHYEVFQATDRPQSTRLFMRPRRRPLPAALTKSPAPTPLSPTSSYICIAINGFIKPLDDVKHWSVLLPLDVIRSCRHSMLMDVVERRVFQWRYDRLCDANRSNHAYPTLELPGMWFHNHHVAQLFVDHVQGLLHEDAYASCSWLEELSALDHLFGNQGQHTWCLAYDSVKSILMFRHRCEWLNNSDKFYRWLPKDATETQTRRLLNELIQ